MSAYATNRNQLYVLPNLTAKATELSVIETVLAQLADRVAAVVVDRLSSAEKPSAADEWLDSRHAAEYLGVHRDTLRKLAAERTIPSEQDGPGCKLYFRRSEMDAWRQGGGRPRYLASAISRAA